MRPIGSLATFGGTLLIALIVFEKNVSALSRGHTAGPSLNQPRPRATPEAVLQDGAFAAPYRR